MKKLALLYFLLPLCLLARDIPVFQDFIWERAPMPREFEGNKLLRDQDNFIWVGGRNELLRHDGQNWEYFQLPSNSASMVSSLAQSLDGKIWVGTERGEVFVRENDFFRAVEFSRSPPSSPIRKIIFDKAGNTWIATYGEGVFFLGEDVQRNMNSESQLPSDFVYDLSLGPEGEIWVATDQGLGLCRKDNDQLTILPLRKEDGLPDELLTSVSHDVEGTAWLGTYGKGCFYQKQHESSWTPLASDETYGVQKLQLLDQKIFIQDEAAGLIYPAWQDAKVLEGQKIKDFCLSPEGHIWVLSLDNELFHAPTYVSSLPLPIHGLQAVAKDSIGNLWLGSDEGLLHFSLQSGMIRQVAPSPKLNITSLCVDHWDKIWIGTLGQGIWSFDPQSEQFSRQNLRGFKNNIPILSLLQSNQQIWIGSFAGSYTIELDRKGKPVSGDNIAKPSALGINYIYQLTKGGEGEIYISADGKGISVANQNRIVPIEELSGSTIFSHAKIEDDQLFCLTDLGEVLLLENSKLDTLFRYEGTSPLALTALDSNQVLIVYEDALFLLNTRDKEVHPFLGGSHSMDMGRSLNLFAHGSDHSLWLGTSKGLLQLAKDDFSAFNCRKVLLKRLLVNLEEVPSEKNAFEWNENHLSIEYASPWWQASKAASFQHRLKGYDLDWVNSKDMRAIYPKLEAGKYIFEARILGTDTYCSSSSLSFSFEIRKPYWQETWFAVLVLFLFASLLVVLMKGQERRINMKKERENILVKNQLDTLTSQINPHFLFNAFSTLTDIVDESTPKAIAYINRLSDLFRNMLAYRKQELISLREELALLDNYYQLQKERYGANFSLEIELEEELLESKIPPLILQILVENALKHNKVSREKPLEVTIYGEDDFLVVKNKIQPKVQTVSSTKIGLNNIRERYRLIAGREVEVDMHGGYFMVKLPTIK